MQEQTKTGRVNPWIATAAYELYEIRKRWRLTSDRQFAGALGLDRRTVAKLNPSCPDGSLALETVDRIYGLLLTLVRVYFTPEEEEEERSRLAYSRMRIALSVAPPTGAVLRALEEETGGNKRTGRRHAIK